MSAATNRLALVAGFAMLAAGSLAQSEPLLPSAISPDEFTWAKSPAGNPRTAIGGDESKPGMYIFRVKLPANLKIAPHYHVDERIGMVISGTLLVGYGEQFDESKMKALPPGGIWTEPAKQPHFVWAKDGEVTIQVTGNGPSATTQVSPK